VVVLGLEWQGRVGASVELKVAVVVLVAARGMVEGMRVVG
jgi:hypothetical protein